MTTFNLNQVETYLKDLKYPARKKDIIDKATRNEVDKEVLKSLQK